MNIRFLPAGSTIIADRFVPAADFKEYPPGNDHISPAKALWRWFSKDPKVGYVIVSCRVFFFSFSHLNLEV